MLILCARACVHIEEFYAQKCLYDRVVEFSQLFRTALPDLYEHFESEEVSLQSWALPWFEYLLSKELPIECVSRLWDVYFSQEDGLDLHPFICLAILRTSKDFLDELESCEIVGFLGRLPQLDVEFIVNEAISLRAELLLAVQ